jgi:hypothetical protein
LTSVIRKSFGSWTAEPKDVPYFPVVGARNRTQMTGKRRISASSPIPIFLRSCACAASARS